VVGNVTTTGDMQVDGTIEGDIRAHMLTVGEAATISGEILADDVVIHGHIRGRVRGVKVRLTSTAKVEGDIIHKTIAIESGAHFEGSVQRQEDPLNLGKPSPAPVAAPKAAAPEPKAAEARQAPAKA
jgi:cytoskeletal protein CcmA (bactofilin family)